MNPYLERALADYYGRRRRKMWIAFAICLALLGGVLIWLAIARPEEGLWAKPMAAIGFPSAFGLIVIPILQLFGDRRLLTILRDRPRDVRRVRRGETVFRTRGGIPIKTVSTLFVDVEGARPCTVYFDGNATEFDRIQRLIEREITARAQI